MKELLKKVLERYEADEAITDSEEKIVYEFVGLFQLDEGVDFAKAVDILLDCLYIND